jgi:putative two-component system response regulator
VKSVLIVDDNLASLKQIGAQLARDYEVSLAKSGELALEICSREPPDLILLDVEMPGMDGFAVIARLKDDPKLMHIPVIFLTGNHDSETEIKGLESGAMDFITKPVNPDILRHRIDIHLSFSAYQLNLEHMVKELEDNIGIAFAELLDCKDFNVTGHVLRTAEYAALLAEELRQAGTCGDEITDEYVEMLKRASLFYDIGKIGISDIILLKRGSLTEEEFRDIQRHTLIGGRVLKVIYDRTPNQHYLKMAITIAEGHHERYDGTGYPRGLKGRDIPLCCQIVSLANVYDSCITDRVYRKAFSHEKTCELIRIASGTKFDPRVVDAFNKANEKFASYKIESQFSFYRSAVEFFL